MANVHRHSLTRLSCGEENLDQFCLNVIFVHGLRGHPRGTWESASVASIDNSDVAKRRNGFKYLFKRKADRRVLEQAQASSSPQTPSKVFWPEEYLSLDVPQAIVWTYGYNADVIGGLFQANNQNSISQHGRDLSIRLERELENRKPIAFVVHSLGGIIVKDAIRRSEEIRERTKLVIFLGTPHRGSAYASWAQIASNLTRLALQDSNKKMLETLEVNNEVLDNIHEEFKTIVADGGIKIHSFQEAQGISGMKGLDGKVVDDFSSKLDLPRTFETVESIDANHMQMARYNSKDDQGYRAISAILRSFVRQELESQTMRPANSADDSSIDALLMTPLSSITEVPGVTAGQQVQRVDGPSVDQLNSMMHPIRKLVEMLQKTLSLWEESIHPQNKEQTWFWRSPEYEDWRSNEGSQFLWCTGKPATGKSSIAATLVSDLSKERIHSESVAHFFFQTPIGRNASPFIPGFVVCSIMAQLLRARYDLTAIHDHAVWLGHNEYTILLKAFRYTVDINHIYEDEQAEYSSEGIGRGHISPKLSRATSALRLLFEDDLWKILKSFVYASAGQIVYIIIDGMESMLTEDQSRFLRNLRDLWSSVQVKSDSSLKILITSRPQVKMQSLLNGLAYIDQDKEYKECLSSLRSGSSNTRRYRVAESLKNTGQWILDHSEYLKWNLQRTSALLWIQGKPGSGKSVLMKHLLHVIEDGIQNCLLRAKYQPVIASFFYSAREGERETSHQHMLQTLLCEVLAHEAELYPHFQESYRRLRATSEGQITWSYNDLKGVFIRITSACEKTLQIYFLIDALDESDRTELLDVLLLLKNSSKASTCVIKILLASRPNEMISKALTGTFRVILEHENKQDIIALVNTKLAFLREPDDTSVFEWTSKYLNEHAQGVFLWVSLIAQELEHLAEGGYSELDVKDMVQKFPIELIDYYKRMIKQLAENGQHVVTEAREMLDWACYTERPLTAIEMRDIIAISSRPDRASTISVHTFETSKLRRLADVKKRIRRNCGDLLEIKKQRSLPQSPNDVQSVEIDSQDVVQLLHQTAREFLIRADKIAQPFNIDEKAANNTIGLICAHYIRLSFAIDEAPVNGSTLPRSVDRWTVDHHKQLLAHLETRPLLHYALKYLPYHLDRTARSSSPAWRLIDDYFHRANENLGFVWYYLQEWFERLEFSRMPVSSLEAMTEFRITGLVAGIKGRTLGAVQALSEVQRNLDHVDCYTDHTALQTAASCGDSATLVFLINNGASVNFHGGHFGTALQAAAYHGHNEVVTILLERGADPNSEAGFWSTAFLGAACSGHENIAKILLNHGSDTYFSPALLERLSSDPGQLDVVGRSSISVFSAIIGSDHTATLNVINSLALAYGKQGQWKKAETMQRRALKGYEEALGPEHPDTLISIKNLGLILERQGKYEEAEAMQRRALEVMERVLGTEHPDTLISMRKLGSILERQGKYEEAEAMQRRALEVMERVLGTEHPDTLISMRKLGSILESQGKYKEAESM